MRGVTDRRSGDVPTQWSLTVVNATRSGQRKVVAWLNPWRKAMPKLEDREPAAGAESTVHHLLVRLREWWQHRNELNTMDVEELTWVARDLGMTGQELKDLAARGPDVVHLLHDRMRVLGLTRADVERVAHGLMRDMERTCACCNEKGVCEKDLAARPNDAAWEGYCPNAVSLTGVKIIKGHFPA
jgi:hypothetical protein